MSQAHILLVEGDIPDSGGYQPSWKRTDLRCIG